MDKEIWLPLNDPYYYDSHLVSSYGRVKTVKGRVLSQRYDHYGYLQLNLSKKGREEGRSVHRLVALAFLKDIYKEGLVVNHKDGVKTNNNVGNLEFVTVQYNTQHAFDIGINPNKGINHVHSKTLLLLDNRNRPVSQYETVTIMEELTGIHRNMLRKWRSNERLKIIELDRLMDNVPTNKKLNIIKEHSECIVKLYDSNKKLIGIYTSQLEFRRKTQISVGVVYKACSKKLYKFKKRGKQFKKKYYLQRGSLIEILTADESIVNKEIQIK